jgi:hypothetical protein
MGGKHPEGHKLRLREMEFPEKHPARRSAMESSGGAFKKVTSHHRRYAMMIIIIVSFLPNIGLSYKEYDEQRILPDAMVINVTDNEVVAFKANTQPSAIELSLGEQVKSMQTSGLVGSVVTSDRMLAISSEAFAWVSMPLGINEESADSYLSVNLALFITMERVMIFDSALNSFAIFDIPVGENIVAQSVQPDVAVFITLERAIGYASGNADFREFSFSAGEIFRDLEVSSGLFSVNTSNRVLLFQIPSSDWVERTLP